VILEELAKVASHPSADEVYEMVRRRLPRISLGTVYRNLEMLSEIGAIRKVAPGGSHMRFDANCRVHYHMRCVRCGRVDDAPVGPLPDIERRVRKQTDYEVLGHNVEFIGVCPRCKADED